MIVSAPITQNSVGRTSAHPVAESDTPSASPSTSAESASGGNLPLPFDFPNLGDPAAEVAALLAIAFQEDRKHAREASDLEELNRFQEGEMRVAELHRKADEIRSEGWTRGLAQVLSAGCSVAGGALSLKSSDPHQGDALLSLSSGGGKGLEAGGMIMGNGHQAEALDHQSNADRHEARAEASKVARDRFEAEASDAGRMFQKVMEFVKEMNEVRNATLQGVASFKA